MKPKLPFTTPESTNVVTQFIHSYLNFQLMPSIQQHMRDKFVLHKILTQGVQQNGKNYFPKIISEIQTHLNGQSDHPFDIPKLHHNPILKKHSKRAYRKSCDDMREVQQDSKQQTRKKKPDWLNRFRDSQQSIAQFNKNVSDSKKSQTSLKSSKKKKVFLKQIPKPNPIRHQRNASMGALTKQQKLGDSRLVKLEDNEEKQDEYIIRKRQKLLKQKMLEKQFQNNIFTMGNESHPIVLNKQDMSNSNNVMTPILSFTTDYNGDIIEFLQEINKPKFGPRKNTTKSKKSDKNYLTTTNSPSKTKDTFGTTSKTNFKDRMGTIEEENPLKEELKIKFKIKKQNFIQPTYTTDPKLIQFDGNSKNYRGKDFTEPSDRSNKTKFELLKNPIDKPRQMAQTFDQKTLIKNFQLSPGVTIHDLNKVLGEDKENGNVSMKLITLKTIGKSTKNLGSQACIPTLKSLMSRKMIKKASALDSGQLQQ